MGIEKKHMLEIYYTNYSDEGRYTCMVLNEKAHAYASMDLKLIKKDSPRQAPEFIKEIQDTVVEEGQSVTFRCKIKGYPKPRICWYKDGILLKNSKNIIMKKIGNRDYTLTIHNITIDDDAEYFVSAQNTLDKLFSYAQLIVETNETQKPHISNDNIILTKNCFPQTNTQLN